MITITRTIKISNQAYEQISDIDGDSFKEKVDNLLDIKNKAISRDEVKELIGRNTMSIEEIEYIIEDKLMEEIR